MQIIDLKTDLVKVRKAFDEKRLSAFDGDRNAEGCEYTASNGRHCAVGEMCSDETLQEIQKRSINAMGINHLFIHKVVGATGDDDAERMLHIMQELHDNWSQNYRIEEFDVAVTISKAIGYRRLPIGQRYTAEVFNEYLTWLEAKMAA